MRTNYKLLALDVDGTLTTSKKTISKKTKEALLWAQEHGTRLLLVSGRPTHGMRPLAEELHMKNYGGILLSYNGGEATELANGNVLYEYALPRHRIGEIYRLAKEYDVNLTTYENDTIITESEEGEFLKIDLKVNGMRLRLVDSFPDYVTFPVPKCLMLGSPQHIAKIEPLVRAALPTLNVFRSEPFFLEIMPKGLDKAASLQRLLPLLGYQKEELIACGDGFNDATMIAFAGLGVAMGNARPPVLEAADYVTASNDEDGVAQVVHTFLKQH